MREEKKVRYCSYCGAKCKTEKVGAENNIIFYGEGTSIPWDSKYNKANGKRNYCLKFTCPNYQVKKWYQFFSPHDSYYENKTIN